MNDRPPTFEEFAAGSQRSAWVEELGISLYVRRRFFAREVADFTLATLQAHQPRGGALTRFLDRYEPQYSFRIECVHEAWLRDYFMRRDYRVIREVRGLEWDLLHVPKGGSE